MRELRGLGLVGNDAGRVEQHAAKQVYVADAFARYDGDTLVPAGDKDMMLVEVEDDGTLPPPVVLSGSLRMSDVGRFEGFVPDKANDQYVFCMTDGGPVCRHKADDIRNAPPTPPAPGNCLRAVQVERVVMWTGSPK
jgi:hypothetical protein